MNLREYYANKFAEQMNKSNYILQEGEKIIQCNESYPPYWFISNKGYLFTAYYKNMKILKPNFDNTGKANKEGKRNGVSWRYGTRKSGNKNLTRYDMGQMIAEHFCEDEFNSSEETEVHHIKKRKSFNQNEAPQCNQASNLQIIPKSVHSRISKHYGAKTNEELDQELLKKIEASNAPVLFLLPDQLEQIVKSMIGTSLGNNAQPIIYTRSITDDVAEIEAEAHPVREIK